MDGCSFMIKETPDQKLLIADSFVTDGVTGNPKQLTPAAPDSFSSPTSFQEIEWAAEFPGNDFEDRPAVRWVLKTYLIADAEDGSMDFERVALLDAATHSISFPSVTRLAPPGTPEELLELRIRESGLVIDTVESLPDAESVVRSKLSGVPSMSVLERELGEGLVNVSGSGSGAGAVAGAGAGEEAGVGVGGEDEDEAFDVSIEDDSDDLDDFLDGGDEIDSEDEEFEGGDELDEDGDDDFD